MSPLGSIKSVVKRIPVARELAEAFYLRVVERNRQFPGSTAYWISRYQQGGNSGDGSYGVLAEYKAYILNEFVQENQISSVIEFGCGDGNQLALSKYPKYLGVDISPHCVERCRSMFSARPHMAFAELAEYKGETADLALSLDVVFHLVEDDVFEEYMHRLFSAAERFVIVYSSNTDHNKSLQASHVRHRQFTSWVSQNIDGWSLSAHVPNPHSYTGDNVTSSFADFYVYKKS